QESRNGDKEIHIYVYKKKNAAGGPAQPAAVPNRERAPGHVAQGERGARPAHVLRRGQAGDGGRERGELRCAGRALGGGGGGRQPRELAVVAQAPEAARPAVVGPAQPRAPVPEAAPSGPLAPPAQPAGQSLRVARRLLRRAAAAAAAAAAACAGRAGGFAGRRHRERPRSPNPFNRTSRFSREGGGPRRGAEPRHAVRRRQRGPSGRARLERTAAAAAGGRPRIGPDQALQNAGPLGVQGPPLPGGARGGEHRVPGSRLVRAPVRGDGQDPRGDDPVRDLRVKLLQAAAGPGFPAQHHRHQGAGAAGAAGEPPAPADDDADAEKGAKGEKANARAGAGKAAHSPRPDGRGGGGGSAGGWAAAASRRRRGPPGIFSEPPLARDPHLPVRLGAGAGVEARRAAGRDAAARLRRRDRVPDVPARGLGRPNGDDVPLEHPALRFVGESRRARCGPQDSAGVETADVPAGLEPTASNERAAEAAPGAARRASEADEPAESDLRQAVLPLAPGAMRAKSQSRTPERPTELAPLHPDRGGQAPSRPATGFGLGADPGKPPSAPGRALTMTTTATTTPTGSRPTSHASAGRALSALASRIKPSSETESSLCLSPARRRRLGKARAAHPKSAPAVEQDLPRRVKEKAEIQQIIQRLERYGLLVRKPLPPVADAAGSTGTSASAGAGGSFDGLSRRPQAPGSITPLRASKTAEPRRTPRYQESAEAARGVARRPKTIDCRAVERAIFTPQEMYPPPKRWRSDDDGATKHLPLWKMVRADRLRIAALAAAAVAKNSSAARSARGSGAGSHPPQTINLRLFLIKSSERRINQMRCEVDEWSQLTNRILQKPPRLAGHRFRQTSSAETGAGPAVTTGYAGRALNAGLPEPGVEKPTTGQQAGARFASEPPGRSGPRRRSALPAGTQLPKRPSTHGGAGVASATEPTESGGSPSANGASASPAPPSSSQGQPPDADGPGTRRSGREGGPRTRRGRRRSTSREPGERKAGVRILKETINSRNGRTDSFWHWNEYAGVREGWLGKKAKLVSISEGRRTRTAPGGRREGDHPGRPATSAGARRRDAAAAAASSEEDLRIAEPVQRTVSFAKITRDLVSARRERKEGNWFPSRPAARGGGGGGGGRADGGREPWKAAAKRLPAWRTAALQRRNSASALAPGPEAPPRGESARGSVFPRVPVLDALAARALLARRLGEGEKPPSPPRGGTYVQEYFARYRPAVL
ncbi:MAG: hypothetical protein BJ554DRAFT_3609, partial [Olpidium bornovanus]